MCRQGSLCPQGCHHLAPLCTAPGPHGVSSPSGSLAMEQQRGGPAEEDSPFLGHTARDREVRIFLFPLDRWLFHCQRSGESYSHPGAAVQEQDHRGGGQKRCCRSLSDQVWSAAAPVSAAGGASLCATCACCLLGCSDAGRCIASLQSRALFKLDFPCIRSIKGLLKKKRYNSVLEVFTFLSSL